MNTKAKGTRAERALIHFFHDHHWSAVRIAGSGSSRYPSPDVLAGNGERRIAIECKVTKEKRKYFSADEIAQLKEFSHRFGAEAWVGVRLAGAAWCFLIAEDLRETKAGWCADEEICRLRGFSQQELIGRNI